MVIARIVAHHPGGTQERSSALAAVPDSVTKVADQSNPPSTPSSPSRVELTYDDYVKSNHRPAFDGMRAIGFLLVVSAHIPVVALFRALQGWTAVWVFLVISGYLLTMLMMREERINGRITLSKFLVKRCCRIIPAYAVAILVYLAACLAVPQFAVDYEDVIAKLPYHLTLLPEYANTTGFNILTHLWTVGVEAKFYLAFPLAFFLAIRAWPARIFVLLAAAVALIAEGSFIAQSYVALLFGALLAVAMEQPLGYAIIAKLTRAPLMVPLALIVTLLVVLRYMEQLTLVALGATYLVSYGIVQVSRVSPLLTWQPLSYIGRRSYGAYLLHFLAIRLGYLIFGDDTTVAGMLTAAFCLVATIPAAELMYRLVENPANNLGRTLLRKRDVAAYG